MRRSVFRSFVFAAGATALAAPALAANWATGVVQYSAGSTYPSPDPNDFSFVPPAGAVNLAYTTPTIPILNGLSETHFYGIMSPFNPAFEPSQLLGIGQGGSLTLQFAAPVRTSGLSLGIHTGAGMIDFDYPNGFAGPTVTEFTIPRRATIAVSNDNLNWFTLGTFDLNTPSNFYAAGVNTPGSQTTVAAGTPANVEQPFAGNQNSFAGENWNQILATLNGSAGGNWFDLSTSGLPSVSHVRLTVPTGSILYLDGVVGIPVPEPASLGILSLGVLSLMLRRRRAH